MKYFIVKRIHLHGLFLRMRLQALIILVIFFIGITEAIAQENSDSSKPKWILSSYFESFIAFKGNATKRAKISDFQYNHNRYNIPKVNHGFMGLEHQGENFRMNVAAHLGTYVEDNYKNEPGFLRNIYTANIGFRINKQKNRWIEAGIFPSYIGFESVNSFDNLTLTRSLLAENSPYFVTGIRTNYSIGTKDELYLYLLTGWQRIVPVKGSSLPSFGFQWIKKLSDDNKINNSFFAGSDYPDAARRMRYFNNFYWQISRGRWSYIVGLDIGAEQKAKKSIAYNYWWSPVIIGAYTLNNKLKAAARLEHYNDQSSVIVKAGNGNPLIGSGISFNLDYSPTPSMLVKAEWRKLSATKQVYLNENGFANGTSYVTLSFSYQLKRNL
jgi:hypothetical protein